MAYYFESDHDALSAGVSSELQPIYAKFFDLHSALHPRIRNHSLDLHPRWQKNAIVSGESASTRAPVTSIALTYFRSREQAEMVERRMGKDNIAQTGAVESYRHPVIELRLTPESFAVELILSPSAWWDQQNLIGKLELPHHRTAFRDVIKGLQSSYRVGFWDGIHLGDMQLSVAELLYGRALDEWMDTFCDSQDWLRVGRWYMPNDPALDDSNILNEVFTQIKSLHNVYAFLLWTSNNNFHNFYEKRANRQTRRTIV